MGILFMGGSHPRHAYIARQIAKSTLLSGLIIERREAFIPDPPPGLNQHLADLFVRHFAGRAAAESRFFSNPELPLGVEPSDLRGELVFPELIVDIDLCLQ